jgi:peptide/nickel transport system permease protein
VIRYIIRRILYAFPILIGVALLTFLLFFQMLKPETMARRQLGKNPTQAQVNSWLAQRGYDKPKIVQFGNHMSSLARFDFGRSDVSNELIWDKIKQGAPVSFQLGVLLLLGGLVASITFALVVAYYRGTYIDLMGTFVSVLLMSIVYLVYIMYGQFLFGRVLKYFPVAGWQGGLQSWQFLLMPVIIGVASGLGSNVRFYRTVMLDEINQDYVRTARAKGVRESAVLFRHVLKNAAIPIITSTVSAIPLLILGSLLLESFFGIPGLGGITFDAIQSLDFATVKAIVFLGSVLYIVGAILTDIAYAAVDPRVRLD